MVGSDRVWRLRFVMLDVRPTDVCLTCGVPKAALAQPRPQPDPMTPWWLTGHCASPTASQTAWMPIKWPRCHSIHLIYATNMSRRVESRLFPQGQHPRSSHVHDIISCKWKRYLSSKLWNYQTANPSLDIFRQVCLQYTTNPAQRTYRCQYI